MTLKITTDQREALFAEVSADLPMLPRLSDTEALHDFSRTAVAPYIRKAVDAYADHLELLAAIAPRAMSPYLGDLFTAEGLVDSGRVSSAVDTIARWLTEHGVTAV